MSNEIKVAILLDQMSWQRASLCSLLSRQPGISLTLYSDIRKTTHNPWVNVKYPISYKSPRGVYLDLFKSKPFPPITINPGIILDFLRNKYDIVIATAFVSFTGIFSWLVCRLRGIRFILASGTTISYEKTRPWFVTLVKKIIVRNCDAYLPHGSQAKEFLKKMGAREDRIFFPFLIAEDPELFSKKRDGYLPQRQRIKDRLGIGNKKVILFVGQLRKRKEPLDLLKAYHIVKVRDKKVSLIFIGSGPEEHTLREYINRHKLEDVLLLGPVDHHELPKYYAISDVFVLPSSAEVWGMVINEAMACSLPIVTTDVVGAVGDLVKDGLNGYVVEPNNPQALADAIYKILSDPESAKRMGKASRAIIKDWNIQGEIEAVMKAIKYCLSRGKS